MNLSTNVKSLVFFDEEKKPQVTTNGIFYAPIAWLGLCSFYLLLLALDEYAVSKWGANIPSTVMHKLKKKNECS